MKYKHYAPTAPLTVLKGGSAFFRATVEAALEKVWSLKKGFFSLLSKKNFAETIQNGWQMLKNCQRGRGAAFLTICHPFGTVFATFFLNPKPECFHNSTELFVMDANMSKLSESQIFDAFRPIHWNILPEIFLNFAHSCINRDLYHVFSYFRWYRSQKLNKNVITCSANGQEVCVLGYVGNIKT